MKNSTDLCKDSDHFNEFSITINNGLTSLDKFELETLLKELRSRCGGLLWSMGGYHTWFQCGEGVEGGGGAPCW